MRYLYFIVSVFLVLSCAMAPITSKKINGVSYVASRDSIYENNVKPVVTVNANYACIMPFGFIRDLNEPKILFNTKRQWYGETKAGAKQYIEELRKKSVKIMLKPQIWVWRGFFTGEIKMENESDWKTLEQSYSEFILEYAKLAEALDVEIFCIGTELDEFIKNRPYYWHQLIKEIKLIYRGKLTYASNWDEYARTPFWEDLDFIGIDAYFPLSIEKTPSIEDCKAGWNKHKSAIREMSEKMNKPILFTEYGYRSVDYAAKEPWKSDSDMDKVNLEAQKNATTALFETFWLESWFAGGFVWKWFHDHENSGGSNNSRFTPQNKPAEDIIKLYYTE